MVRYKTRSSKLRVFGCAAIALIPDNKRQKLSDRALKCVFLGYLDNSTGYLLFDLTNNLSIESRDVWFNEEEFPFHELSRSDLLNDY